MHPPMHPDRRFHSKYLLQLLGLEVTEALVDYLAEKVVGAVYIPGDRKETHHRQERKRMSGFGEFAQNFVRNAPGGMPAILVALVYVTRTKSRFLATSTTHDWGRHGVFLGALIVASKYISDPYFRTLTWVRAAELRGKPAKFSKWDMEAIEREFLKLHDWQLGFTEEEILAHYNAIARLYELPKRSPKRPLSPPPYSSPLPRCPSPQLPSRTAVVPPVRDVPPRHTRVRMGGSTTRHNVLIPQPQPSYTVVVVYPPTRRR
ncbi:hypothetical protein BJ322DRAFT_137498 [Thelephora terrestris]|uniref:Cyclin N-terminal domain-containing protein n=1 Tax=Thelephora terrestris TaxID=56493 RepID=A0A9P6L574_9AGAM|nr:hypothetical protein BJ322DRAFT_137498 [Thelephora terrestris]